VEGQGAVLLGVGYQEEEGTMREAREEFGLTYPLGVDEGDRTAELYGITGVPETFVIDEEGKVAYVHVGPVTAEQLLAEVAGLGVAP
jgi:cytochrome c biogenesis protein CcmG/thiol:disulfide interchange protein DsbE